MTLKEFKKEKKVVLSDTFLGNNMKQIQCSPLGFGVLFLRSRKAAPDCSASSRLSITPVSSPSVKRDAGNSISPQGFHSNVKAYTETGDGDGRGKKDHKPELNQQFQNKIGLSLSHKSNIF